jgi:probable rRNA maturation factor
VNLHNGCPGLSVPAPATRAVFHHLDRLGHWTVPEGELSIAFLDRAAMCGVHAAFLNDESLTDVITFEGVAEAGVAGEICVAPDHALEFKGADRLPFAEELTLYLVHGYLHLAGLDDVDPEDRKQMRVAERRAMASLRDANAIPGFSYQP